MTEHRREFLLATAALAASAAAAARAGLVGPSAADPTAGQIVRQSPEPDSDPITVETIREAEKLTGVRFTATEREQIVRTIEEHTRTLRRVARDLPNELAPASIFSPRVPGLRSPLLTAEGDPNALPAGAPPVPASDEDIAFAPLLDVARWLRDRSITSERLTQISLARIARLDPKLLACITVLGDRAMADARAADAEIAAGRWRGPLHGVPYGLKDIVDTQGIATTWGAEPWKDRVPQLDAVITTRLRAAGAVLVAKTAVGALAYGDIWFGGQCRSPWNVEMGSSGSSAGSASGVAAGLFHFAIGTETLGSIVSPCDRCGTAGLRPTFGRVARTGVMSLVWSMDKIGPITRRIEDCGLVLAAINGADVQDPSSVDEPFHWTAGRDAKGLTLGYDPKWCREGAHAETATKAVEAARRAGFEVIEIGLPRIDPSAVIVSLTAEAAASFDQLTRQDLDDQLRWQDDEAWPNTFRKARFIPAIDFVNADRIRRRYCLAMHDLFDQLHVVLAPPFAGNLLTLTNGTGHPCAVIRGGFDATGAPQAMTLMGRLFDEGTLLRAAHAIESELGVWSKRPAVG